MMNITMFLQKFGASRALSLQVKEGTKPYQALPRHMAYALQEPCKRELDCLHEQQIIVPQEMIWYMSGAAAFCWSQNQMVPSLVFEYSKSQPGVNQASTWGSNWQWCISETNKHMLPNNNNSGYHNLRVDNIFKLAVDKL